MTRAPAIAVLTLVALLSACSALVPSPAAVTLRTLPPETAGGMCLGVSFGTTRLIVDPDAAAGSQVLVESELLGRMTPIWPFGWTAKFDPEFRIYDRSGQPVVTVGKSFEAGGSNRGDGTLWMCEVNGRDVM